MFGGIAVLALVFIFWVSRGTPATDQHNMMNGGNMAGLADAQSALTASEMMYDFGSISMRNGKVNRVFSVQNNSSEPVKITKMYTSCMCTEATLISRGEKMGPLGMPGHGFVPNLNQVLEPNETAEVEVIFDPAAHGPAGIGTIERAVYLEQEGRAPLTLEIKALVTP